MKKSLFKMQIEKNPKCHELKIALNMVGLNVDMRATDLIIRAQDSLKKMKDGFDLKTACKIKNEVDEKYSKLEDEFLKQQ